MVCGRESRRSAATAAAGSAQPRMSTLALVLALLSTVPRGAFSQGLAPQQNVTCHNIQHPFGIRRMSVSGFEVMCGPNNEAMLKIAENQYKIDAVSVPESYVVIFAGPLMQVCYDRNGKPKPATGTGAMRLEGTPFSFSKRNKLVNIGCNYKLVANFTTLSGDLAADCITSCDGKSDAIIDRSCSGEACCQMDIPVDAARSFNVSFERMYPGNAGYEDGICNAAFFLDSEEKVFTSRDSDEGESPLKLKDALLPQGERRMILDWAIGAATCEQALGFTPGPLCKDMGKCVNAPRRVGYICICAEGYEGNPYVSGSGGCQDIDECHHPYLNNCTSPSLCVNTPGNYTCRCPGNQTGDGYRTGTSCKDEHLPLGSPPPQQQGSPPPQQQGRIKRKFPLDAVLGVGLALMVTITVTLLCYGWTMKKRDLERKRAELFRKNGGLLLQQKFSAMTSEEKGLSAKIFSAEELKIATDNYSETRVLGRGGQGTVYKGILSDKTVVAIKKAKVSDESQVEQFVNEIAILSQIGHPNVVKLFGCCLETQVPLLVYEFVANGTLFQHIHNRNVPCSLTWKDSLRIATEIADALAYLHSSSSIPIIHRDIKSSNILLDEHLVAKIADFGASRSVPFDRTHITTLIQGTIGYLDPEYFQSSQLNDKSDVYSFGVVLAELLTRQKPISVLRPEESRNLAMHMVILFNEEKLLQEIDPQILAEAGTNQLYEFAVLSVRCLNVKGEERPTMSEVASVLDRLKRSFSMGQNIVRKDELVQENTEQVKDHPST